MICPPVEAGTPDIIACVDGIFVGLELKTSQGRLSKIQSYRLDQIKEASGIGVVIRCKADLLKLLSTHES